eukprot:GFYU01001738.1.p1 GENE.GFYU01001738.1~~GFYU01001738.1.p1  ORF type:complete len:463 (+),score=126.50 GFYU01001738.1:300-1688(+)
MPFEQTKMAFQARLQAIFTPKVLLAFLTAINFLNYIDRGIIAGMLNDIEETYGIGQFEASILQTAFIGGYTAFNPLFAYLSSSQTLRPQTILTIGLAVWVVSTMLSGVLGTYSLMVVARTFVGVGEASFTCISPSLIDDVAPPEKRNNWLGIYYMCIPVGMAFGYGLGAVLAEQWDWRMAFVLESLCMIPFTIVAFYLPLQSPKHGDYQCMNPDEDINMALDAGKPTKAYGLTEALTAIFTNGPYVVITLGYCAYNAFLGTVAYFAPLYVEKTYSDQFDGSKATIVLGGISMITGIVGTVAGAWLVDRMGGSKGHGSASKAMKVNTWCCIVGLPLCFLAVMSDNVWVFFAGLFFGELAIFGATAVVNGALMSVVEDDLRPWAMGMSSFMIHALGDVPGDLAVGAIIDSNGYRFGMGVAVCCLVPAVLLWGWSWAWCRKIANNEALMAPLIEATGDAFSTSMD